MRQSRPVVRPPRLAVLALSAAVAGCASTTRGDGAVTSDPRNDAGLLADASRESRPVRLTLPPVSDWQESEAGYGEPLALDGVHVCVARARPSGKMAWTDFVEVDGPCTTSVAGENIVLDGVPGVSELIVTADRDGYLPSAFAVTTDRWDQDATRQAGPGIRMRKLEAPWASLPAGAVISADRGVVDVKATMCRGFTCSFAGGASIGIDPVVGSGPFYTVAGRLDTAASETRGGASSVLVAGGATFANLPEGEYRVTVHVPGASCRVNGWFWGDPIFGFGSSTEDSIGVPVLAGHLTPNIAALCTCGWQSSFDASSGTCTAGPDASPP